MFLKSSCVKMPTGAIAPLVTGAVAPPVRALGATAATAAGSGAAGLALEGMGGAGAPAPVMAAVPREGLCANCIEYASKLERASERFFSILVPLLMYASTTSPSATVMRPASSAAND